MCFIDRYDIETKTPCIRLGFNVWLVVFKFMLYYLTVLNSIDRNLTLSYNQSLTLAFKLNINIYLMFFKVQINSKNIVILLNEHQDCKKTRYPFIANSDFNTVLLNEIDGRSTDR